MAGYVACVRPIKALPAFFVKTISKKIHLLLQSLKALSTKQVWIIDALLATHMGKICLEINVTLRKESQEKKKEGDLDDIIETPASSCAKATCILGFRLSGPINSHLSLKLIKVGFL